MKIFITHFKSFFLVFSSLVLFSACSASKRCGCPPVGDFQFEIGEEQCQLDSKEYEDSFN